MDKYYEIFRAGKYPQGAFTKEDIELLAKNYDPKFCEAPITLDHGQSGPAYGWIEELRAENGVLKARFRNVSGELKELVLTGKYKKVSVEIYRDLEGKGIYLKAVTFLGAGIPQVKGMEPVKFKDGESEIYIFELVELPKNEHSEFHEEPISEIKVSEELVKLQNQISELESQVVLFVEKPAKNEYSELVEKLQEKVQSMSTQISTLKDESFMRQKSEQELAKLKLKMKTTEFENFLDQQVASGNLTPLQKDMSLKLFFALDSVKKFDESDCVEDFKQFLKTFPKQVEFKEIAKGKQPETDISKYSNASEDSINIYQEAMQLVERDKISFKDALLKIYE